MEDKGEASLGTGHSTLYNLALLSFIRVIGCPSEDRKILPT
jgi:hypothetical protein